MIVVVKNILKAGKYGSAIFHAVCEEDKHHKIIGDFKMLPRIPLRAKCGMSMVSGVFIMARPAFHLNKSRTEAALRASFS